MIEYSLRNSNDDLLPLNDATVSNPAKDSTTLTDDNFNFDNKIVENSALPGAVQLGKRRLISRNLNITFSRAESDYSDFKIAENALLSFLKDTVYLVDVTNDRQILVSIEGYDISYDEGSYQHSSNNSINLKLLEPFWTALTATNTSESLAIDINQISLSALGSLDLPPVITFTASSAVTELQVYIDETKIGIQIEDDLFGTSTYNDLILDCKNGTLTLEGLDRINSIIPGTGFFNAPYTASTLIVIPDAICTMSLDRYRRDYI